MNVLLARSLFFRVFWGLLAVEGFGDWRPMDMKEFL